jgi:pre-60S factor REI1
MSAKHKAKLATAGKGHNDDASSVMSSTFSLGDPMAVSTHEEIDSDVEEEFNEVVEGIKRTNLKETSAANRRPSRPHHSAGTDQERDSSVKTASSASAAEAISKEDALKRCLFCNFDSPSVPLNAAHMERVHGMFIPERNYLVDLEGLVGSLYEKIHEYHECLYCGKLKPTIFGLQTHMRDKGHCMIPFHTEDEQLEIGEFYDFTSTYSDFEDELDSEDNVDEKETGGVKLGAKRPTKTTNEDGDEEMEEGDGWETDSSASSLDSADLTAVPLDQREHSYEKLSQHPHHTHADPRPHRNKDGWHSHAHKHAHAAFHSEYELYLPSGRTAGHRSLNKYYRQNLRDYPSAAERQEQLAIEAAASSDEDEDEENQDKRVARQSERGRGRAMRTRATNELGMVGVTAEKRKEVQAAEKRARKIENREQRKFGWGVNKVGNSQKHFRVSTSVVLFAYTIHGLMIHRILCFNDQPKFSWRIFTRFLGSYYLQI